MQRNTQTPAIGITVTCPCCHGNKRLIVFDEALETDVTVLCCHCIDGRVPAEVDEDSGSSLYVGPHAYVPDASHYMGDCAVCGHTQSSPVHT